MFSVDHFLRTSTCVCAPSPRSAGRVEYWIETPIDAALRFKDRATPGEAKRVFMAFFVDCDTCPVPSLVG